MTKPITDTITVKNLLKTPEITIPNYQRPYKWTAKNVNQLIDDIIFHSDKSAYRLGTLVIHNEEDNDTTSYNIVDGQQRTLTLTLIAIAITRNCAERLKNIYKRNETLDNYKPEVANLKFITNDITKANIQNNYKTIERRINDFNEETIRFFYEKCELVKVVLTDITEAFQFFDSQNVRGKDLEPHDLLKAFHLREMNNFSTEEERKRTIEDWESMDTDKLSKLFALYLFRIRNWSKGYSARYFTKNDVNIFKGVSPDIQEDYPYAKAYRISHYYTDNYNKSYHRGIDKNKFDYPFQIDQTMINGKRFFEMVSFYDTMIDEIRNNKNYPIMETIKSYTGNHRTGDKYVRNLFYCGIIYYIDKFGKKDLSKAIEIIFIWAYSLRLNLFSIGIDSVDNYALNKAHSQVQLFKKIREAIRPNDIINIKLANIKENRSSKTEEIVELFKEMKYYEPSNRTI